MKNRRLIDTLSIIALLLATLFTANSCMPIPDEPTETLNGIWRCSTMNADIIIEGDRAVLYNSPASPNRYDRSLWDFVFEYGWVKKGEPVITDFVKTARLTYSCQMLWYSYYATGGILSGIEWHDGVITLSDDFYSFTVVSEDDYGNQQKLTFERMLKL